jgi:hypothetical protein
VASVAVASAGAAFVGVTSAGEQAG